MLIKNIYKVLKILKNIVKKFFTVILGAVMVFAMNIPFVSATETSGTIGEDITWNFNETTGVLTISGTGAMNDDPWEDLKSEIKTVVIGDGITTIKYEAFRSCHLLTSVTIPDSVTTIGDSAFFLCEALANITIPENVTSVGESAFYGTAYYMDSANWENGVLYIGNFLVATNSSLLPTEYTVKEGTKVIAGGAFEFAGITSIAIPNSVKTIGDGAFENCGALAKVTIPSGLTKIQPMAFKSCTSLTSITIPEGVTMIGEDAFRYSGLASITIPDSVTSIENNAFDGTAYYDDASNWENGVLYIGKHLIKAEKEEVSGSYAVKDGTIMIARCAFIDCESLTNITIPDSVVSIGFSAFSCCKSLYSVTIGNGVTEIKDGTFDDCESLSSVTIGNSVKSIGLSAFYDCDSLTSIVIPDSVTTIGGGAFTFCDNLSNVTIGSGVKEIANKAFDGCYGITNVYYNGTKAEWGKISIGEKDNECLLNATMHFKQSGSADSGNAQEAPGGTEAKSEAEKDSGGSGGTVVIIIVVVAVVLVVAAGAGVFFLKKKKK